MINTLCWNIRGIRSKGTLPYLKYLLSKFKPELLILLEPMVDGSQLDKFKRDIHFDEAQHGGNKNNKIWVLRRTSFTIEEMQWEEQYVSCKITLGDKLFWYSFVYAKCKRDERQVLWDNLVARADVINVPWMVGRDFNTIAHPEEKHGKQKADEKAIMDFNNFQMRAGLSDAGFSGNQYTWTNNRQGDDIILERLDRFLIKGSFVADYGFPKITHLARNSPFMCESTNNMKSPSRFHYMRIWQTHPGLREVIKEHWQGRLHIHPLKIFALKLRHLRQVLRKWNWEIFGDLNRKKAICLRILRSIIMTWKKDGTLKPLPS